MANINAYKPTRLRNGRLRFTSQIWLSAFSTVSSRAIAVTSTNSEPAQVRLFAFAANWLRYLRTVREISIGSRLFNRICSIACSKRLKIGKRVKSAKLTANSGTIDSTVVKVRLPATWASRSSRARRIVSRVRLIMRRHCAGSPHRLLAMLPTMNELSTRSARRAATHRHVVLPIRLALGSGRANQAPTIARPATM